MDSGSNWSWTLRGIEGSIKIAEMLQAEGAAISDHFLMELEQCQRRLARLTAKLKGQPEPPPPVAPSEREPADNSPRQDSTPPPEDS